MTNRPAFLQAFISIAFIVTFAAIADAQATRTWVSGVGDDVNPCSRTAPCKTFAGAISKTATNGEINCLDPAGYGAVTITKSITIDCEDTQGSILASGTNGIIVNLTAVGDTRRSVILRGLNINGAATGINGVRVLSATSVVIEETVIDGFSQNGISIENTTPVQVTINDTSIRNNVVAGVGGASTGTAEIAVSKCLIARNGSGLVASPNVTFRISGNLIAHNTTGLSGGGGKIISFRNNAIDANGTNGTPTSAVALQ